MAVGDLKHFVIRNKEVVMFLVGFGIIHYGWYIIQRSSTLNKAIIAAHDKETLKEYKRLEKEINDNWSDQQNIQQKQNSGVILNAAIAFTNKSTKTD